MTQTALASHARLRSRCIWVAALLWAAAGTGLAGERGDVLVRAVDRNGQPIAGALVVHSLTGQFTRAKTTFRFRTDAAGTVRLRDVLLDGSSWVWVRDDAHRRHDGDWPYWARGKEIDARVVEIRSEYGVPLDVAIVDAESGEPVPGAAWGTGWVQPGGDPKRTLVGRTARVSPEEGRQRLGFHVEAPAGYVAWRYPYCDVRVRGDIHALTAVYPMNRAVPVEATLLDSTGSPVTGRVVAMSVAGRTIVDPPQATAQDGTLRVDGVPFFREEFVELWVTETKDDDPFRCIRWRGRLAATPAEPLRARIMFPADASSYEEAPSASDPSDPRDEGNVLIGLGGGYRQVPSTRVYGGMRISCVRADGSPATNVTVYGRGPEYRLVGDDDDHVFHRTQWGKSDAGGNVAWEKCDVGEWTVRFSGDRHTARASVRVAEGGIADVEIREPLGGEVRLCVVDGSGRPLPFSSFSVEQEGELSWSDLPAPALRADAYVGADGRRVLRSVEPGEHAIEVSYGRRRGTARVAVADRGVHDVRVELPPP